jgi:transcriptional regulator with XRE-family HTH domain
MSLGARIRQAREARNLSQAEVARAFKLTREAVSQWESGGTAPTLDRFEALSDLLGVSGEWLLTGRGRPDAMHNVRPDEATLLTAYRALDKQARTAVGNLIANLSPQRQSEERPFRQRRLSR